MGKKRRTKSSKIVTQTLNQTKDQKKAVNKRNNYVPCKLSENEKVQSLDKDFTNENKMMRKMFHHSWHRYRAKMMQKETSVAEHSVGERIARGLMCIEPLEQLVALNKRCTNRDYLKRQRITRENVSRCVNPVVPVSKTNDHRNVEPDNLTVDIQFGKNKSNDSKIGYSNSICSKRGISSDDKENPLNEQEQSSTSSSPHSSGISSSSDSSCTISAESTSCSDSSGELENGSGDLDYCFDEDAGEVLSANREKHERATSSEFEYVPLAMLCELSCRQRFHGVLRNKAQFTTTLRGEYASTSTCKEHSTDFQISPSHAADCSSTEKALSTDRGSGSTTVCFKMSSVPTSSRKQFDAGQLLASGKQNLNADTSNDFQNLIVDHTTNAPSCKGSFIAEIGSEAQDTTPLNLCTVDRAKTVTQVSHALDGISPHTGSASQRPSGTTSDKPPTYKICNPRESTEILVQNESVDNAPPHIGDFEDVRHGTNTQ